MNVDKALDLAIAALDKQAQPYRVYRDQVKRGGELEKDATPKVKRYMELMEAIQVLTQLQGSYQTMPLFMGKTDD